MAKNIKQGKSDTANPITRKLKQSASQIWLAGLGAYSKAEEEGNKLFDTLVREGESAKHLLDVIIDKPKSLYQGTVEDVRGRVVEVKDKAVGSWDRIEKIFDERVSSALHRLNIPTRQDVADLAKQVMQCKAELRQLQQAQKTPLKSSAKTSSKPVSKSSAKEATKAKEVSKKSQTKKSPAKPKVVTELTQAKTLKAPLKKAVKTTKKPVIAKKALQKKMVKKIALK